MLYCVVLCTASQAGGILGQQTAGGLFGGQQQQQQQQLGGAGLFNQAKPAAGGIFGQTQAATGLVSILSLLSFIMATLFSSTSTSLAVAVCHCSFSCSHFPLAPF